MTKRMLIDALHSDETRVVVLDHDRIQDFDFTTVSKRQIKSNIYLAKVTRVEPSLQAAFVEYGGGKQGFLPFAEIHPDYYQIPVSDRQRLIEEAMREDGEHHDDDHHHADDNWRDNFSDSFAAAAGAETGDAAFDVPSVLFNTPEGESTSEASVEAAPYAALIRVLRSAPLPESGSEIADEKPHAVAADAAPAFNFDAVMASPILPLQLVTQTDEQQGETQPQDFAEQPEARERDRGRDRDRGDSDADAEEDVVETLGDEEDEVRARRKNNASRRYRIQEVIKRGQIMLVQVIKEERGNKGVSLTTYISLPGRYCVLMPNSTKGGGISRKIAGSEHRKRLRELVGELSEPQGMSVIIRTAGMDRSTSDIRRDYDYLVRLWNQIRETTMTSSAPALIYEEGDIIKRSIRDMYTSDIDEVLVSGEAAYTEARDFMDMLMPQHGGRVLQYQDATPLFHYYGVENKLTNMYEPTARLRSGGYLVINPTEALISIDVNSGRSTGERNIEETAKKTNLEAAEEVARQLRLRDLAGLIVIDFIDMGESRHRRAVERALKDALKADRAKIQIGRISPFGLLEMSRQRLRPSIAEAAMVTCSHCNGRGHVRADNTVAIQITRAIQHELALGACDELRVLTSNNVALYLLNHYRKVLTELEVKYGVPIRVLVSDKVAVDGFQIERIGGAAIREEQRRGAGVQRGGNRNNNRRDRERENRERDEDENRSEDAAKEPRQPRRSRNEPRTEDGEDRPERTEGEEGGERRRRSRGGRRRGGRNRDGEAAQDNDAVAVEGAEAATKEAADGEGFEAGDRAEGEEGGERRRRSRGGRRRGGRNRRGNREGVEGMSEGDAAEVAARPAMEAPEGEAAASSEGRGERGGRNRGPRRNENPSGRRGDYDREPAAPREASAPRSESPAPRSESVPVSAPIAAPSVQSFAPANFGTSTAAPSSTVSNDSGSDSDKPKRFGWWRK